MFLRLHNILRINSDVNSNKNEFRKFTKMVPPPLRLRKTVKMGKNVAENYEIPVLLGTFLVNRCDPLK